MPSTARNSPNVRVRPWVSTASSIVRDSIGPASGIRGGCRAGCASGACRDAIRWTINEPSGPRTQPVPSPARRQPGRLVSVGRRGVRAGARGEKPIFLSIGYSTCHWCHVMEHESFENAGDRRGAQPGLRVDQGRSRGAPGRRSRLHDVRAGDHRIGRLADERLPHAGAQAVLRRHLLPADVEVGPARVRRPARRARARVARGSRAGRRLPRRSCFDRLKSVTGADGRAQADGGRRRRRRARRGRRAVPDGLRPAAAAASATRRSFRARRSCCSCCASTPGAGRRARPAGAAADGHRHAARDGARAACAITSAAASTATPSTARGGCRTSRRCSTTRRSWCSRISRRRRRPATRSSPTVAEDTLAYVARDLHDPQGGFYSAEDADSVPPGAGGRRAHKSKGAFYIWTDAEIGALLGEDADDRRGAGSGSSRRQCAAGSAGGVPRQNLLYVAAVDRRHRRAARRRRKRRSPRHWPRSARGSVRGPRRPAAPAPRRQGPDGVERPDDRRVRARGARARAGAHAAGGYLDGGTTAPPHSSGRTLWRAGRPALLRRYRDGDAAIDAYAEDFASLICGLLELFQADGDPAWLDWAIALQARQDALFWDPADGGWFSTTGDDPDRPAAAEGGLRRRRAVGGLGLRPQPDHAGASHGRSDTSRAGRSRRWRATAPRAGAAARGDSDDAGARSRPGTPAHAQIVIVGDAERRADRARSSAELARHYRAVRGGACRWRRARGSRARAPRCRSSLPCTAGRRRRCRLCLPALHLPGAGDDARPRCGRALNACTGILGIAMTFDVEIVLRERNFASPSASKPAEPPAAWTRGDVEQVLKSILLAIDRVKNPGDEPTLRRAARLQLDRRADHRRGRDRDRDPDGRGGRGSLHGGAAQARHNDHARARRSCARPHGGALIRFPPRRWQPLAIRFPTPRLSHCTTAD